MHIFVDEGEGGGGAAGSGANNEDVASQVHAVGAYLEIEGRGVNFRFKSVAEGVDCEGRSEDLNGECGVKF